VTALGNANALFSIADPLPSFKALFLSFSSPLTNLGGEIALRQAPAEIAFTNTSTNTSLLFRSISAGSVSATATPIPTPALLPGLIGLGMGIARKRKQGETSAELKASKA
jgi:hypothetical protein